VEPCYHFLADFKDPAVGAAAAFWLAFLVDFLEELLIRDFFAVAMMISSSV
jgi:hypothetical protein